MEGGSGITGPVGRRSHRGPSSQLLEVCPYIEILLTPEASLEAQPVQEIVILGPL